MIYRFVNDLSFADSKLPKESSYEADSVPIAVSNDDGIFINNDISG